MQALLNDPTRVHPDVSIVHTLPAIVTDDPDATIQEIARDRRRGWMLLAVTSLLFVVLVSWAIVQSSYPDPVEVRRRASMTGAARNAETALLFVPAAVAGAGIYGVMTLYTDPGFRHGFHRSVHWTLERI